MLALSREHHTSLVMARDAKHAANDNDAAACAAAITRIEAHWHNLMAAHVDQEERLIRMAADTLDPALMARIFADHAELRTLAGGPCSLEPAARLRRFADLTIAHVRYEERTFFPQLQSHPCVAVASATTPSPIQSNP
ncbi:hemerythrin domain-containing protein [Nitrosospira sp. Nl5]|uniref:hemerythrin domain-containing protein n=1 Tax=Nitrosospira sp. Nl5 TaxID=200120 RepID=UPI00210E5E11|nr:hemerythrin domain-containing protein [Nitrosospira sp. Nl5]